MKGKLVFVSTIILGALLLSACGFGVLRGSGNVVTESREVGNFDSVDFSGSGDVIIDQNGTEGLKIEAEDNLVPHIRTEVRGHTLHIYFDPMGMVMLHPTKPMKFHLSMKDVTSVDLSGSGTIYSEKITASSLSMKISGSGDTTIDSLTTDRLDIDISGSGKCLLKGDAAILSLNISGSGNCNSSNLNSKDVRIDVSGSGKAQVKADNRLDINISGSGDVIYSGNPRISQTVSGSGQISAR